MVSVSTNGSNDAEMTVQRVDQTTAGTIVVTCKNNGAAAVNGNIIINIWILN